MGAEVRAASTRANRGGLIRATEALRDRRDSTEFVRDYERPLWVVAGSEDPFLPEAKHGRLSSRRQTAASRCSRGPATSRTSSDGTASTSC